mgnify:CR=1 FL=1
MPDFPKSTRTIGIFPMSRVAWSSVQNPRLFPRRAISASVIPFCERSHSRHSRVWSRQRSSVKFSGSGISALIPKCGWSMRRRLHFHCTRRMHACIRADCSMLEPNQGAKTTHFLLPRTLWICAFAQVLVEIVSNFIGMIVFSVHFLSKYNFIAQRLFYIDIIKIIL